MNDSLKNNTTYFNLTKVKEQKYAVEIHPKPTKDDFENGFYIRYFVSQKNTNDNIIEIDKTQYDGFLDSKFYTIFNMRWMLPDDTEENMKINMDAISLLNKTYPAFRQKMRPFAMKQSTYIEAGGISATGSKDSNIVIATKRIDEIPVTQPIRTVSQVTQVSLLPPPAALSATAIKSDGFTLNWTAVSGATNYYVCVSTASNFSSYIFQYETGYWDHKIVGNVTSVSIASILEPTVVSNTKFYFRIQSYREGGRSNYSNTMELTTLPIYWTPPEFNTDVEQNVVIWLDAMYIQGVTNGFNLKQHPDGG
ncbi:MAG: fibronectin type III domain-containing protein, partial [Methanogenium sp.]